MPSPATALPTRNLEGVGDGRTGSSQAAALSSVSPDPDQMKDHCDSIIQYGRTVDCLICLLTWFLNYQSIDRFLFVWSFDWLIDWSIRGIPEYRSQKTKNVYKNEEK